MPEPARIHVRPGKAAIIVLGSSQRALVTDSALPVRVRSSGGGAVLSGPWLLRAAVALPRTHTVVQHGPAAAARWYGEIHCRWLHANGIGAAALYQGATIDHWACFAGRAAGEIVVGERKIVGIAQAWRGHSVLLSAGTLIAPAPWALLCDSLRRSPDAASKLAALTTNAQDYLRQPVDSRAWAEALLSSLRLAVAQCEESRGLHANATYLRAGSNATTCAHVIALSDPPTRSSGP